MSSLSGGSSPTKVTTKVLCFRVSFFSIYTSGSSRANVIPATVAFAEGLIQIISVLGPFVCPNFENLNLYPPSFFYFLCAISL
jgi:hypothetical protein